MGVFKDSGRKNTGRTDEFSDETPKKDFKDFRNKHPQSEDVIPRKTAREISQQKTANQFLGVPGIAAALQYINAKTISFRETWNPDSPELKEWKREMDAAVKLYTLVSNAKRGSVSATFADDVAELLEILK